MTPERFMIFSSFLVFLFLDLLFSKGQKTSQKCCSFEYGYKPSGCPDINLKLNCIYTEDNQSSCSPTEWLKDCPQCLTCHDASWSSASQKSPGDHHFKTTQDAANRNKPRLSPWDCFFLRYFEWPLEEKPAVWSPVLLINPWLRYQKRAFSPWGFSLWFSPSVMANDVTALSPSD